MAPSASQEQAGLRLLRRLGSLALPRLLTGLIAMALKLSVWFLAAARAGVVVPAFRPPRRGRLALMATGLAAECGGLSDLAGLCDIFFESADGTRLHAVEDDGSRRLVGMRPIVFVHGFPELWVIWRRQLKAFADRGHPVLALSPRGYALSDKPRHLSAYHMDRLAEDVAAACRHSASTARPTKNGPATQAPLLVAHDWGAAIAWHAVITAEAETGRPEIEPETVIPAEAAARRTKIEPDTAPNADAGAAPNAGTGRDPNADALPVAGTAASKMPVAGLVACGVPNPEAFYIAVTSSLSQFWASLYVLFFNMPLVPELLLTANSGYYTAYATQLLPPIGRRRPSPSVEVSSMYRVNATQPGSMSAMLNYYRAALQLPPPPHVLGPDAKLKLPVVVVRADQDIFLGEALFHELGSHLANFELVILRQCSHWMTADAPDEINDVISSILHKLEVGGAA